MPTKNIGDINSIEDAVRVITEIKRGLMAAQNGVQIAGPQLGMQVAMMYELAGEDEDEANARGSEVRRTASQAVEHVEALTNILREIGGQVARAIRAKEEAEARRKLLAAKTGTRAGAKTSTSTIQV